VYNFANTYQGNYNDCLKPFVCPFYCDWSGFLVDIQKYVDYILGNNPLGMFVGYGNKFPTRIHHRASSVPSLDQYPQQMHCKDGTPYFETSNPNPNLPIGAVVGGPDMMDQFAEARVDYAASEPTTYINAPLTGLFAYFAHNT
ncbi:hypothetical protein MKX01_008174, partial [Papaver californicum]